MNYLTLLMFLDKDSLPLPAFVHSPGKSAGAAKLVKMDSGKVQSLSHASLVEAALLDAAE